MLILGLDPGTATVGFALLQKNKNKLVAAQYGCVRTKPGEDAGARLVHIEKELKKIIKQFEPQEAAIERLFFMNNIKTAMAVSQARGVMLMTLAKLKLPTFEYTPLQVKLSVTGYGNAPKLQVQKMVKTVLKLNDLPQPDDAADALAIAICHSYQIKFKVKKEKLK
ncbi:MAG: crossover junction endodeoxyribonuclease RuvC [Candidatus Moraniibacteriota bacterium]